MSTTPDRSSEQSPRDVPPKGLLAWNKFCTVDRALWLRMLDSLAALAQGEYWGGADQWILEHYLQRTFETITQQKKLAYFQETQFKVEMAGFHTGLVSNHYEDIYCLFHKTPVQQSQQGKLVGKRRGEWTPAGFHCQSAAMHRGCQVLQRATYSQDPADLMLDMRCETKPNFGYLLEKLPPVRCIHAFKNPSVDRPEDQLEILHSAYDRVKKMMTLNPKTAVPQRDYVVQPQRGSDVCHLEGREGFLVPLYLSSPANAYPELVLLLQREQKGKVENKKTTENTDNNKNNKEQKDHRDHTDNDSLKEKKKEEDGAAEYYYVGTDLLSVEKAYLGARLVMKVDTLWLEHGVKGLGTARQQDMLFNNRSPPPPMLNQRPGQSPPLLIGGTSTPPNLMYPYPPSPGPPHPGRYTHSPYDTPPHMQQHNCNNMGGGPEYDYGVTNPAAPPPMPPPLIKTAGHGPHSQMYQTPSPVFVHQQGGPAMYFPQPTGGGMYPCTPTRAPVPVPTNLPPQPHMHNNDTTQLNLHTPTRLHYDEHDDSLLVETPPPTTNPSITSIPQTPPPTTNPTMSPMQAKIIASNGNSTPPSTPPMAGGRLDESGGEISIHESTPGPSVPSPHSRSDEANHNNSIESIGAATPNKRLVTPTKHSDRHSNTNSPSSGTNPKMPLPKKADPKRGSTAPPQHQHQQHQQQQHQHQQQQQQLGQDHRNNKPENSHPKFRDHYNNNKQIDADYWRPITLTDNQRSYIRYIVVNAPPVPGRPLSDEQYSVGIKYVLQSRGASMLLSILEQNVGAEYKKGAQSNLCKSVLLSSMCEKGKECPDIHVLPEGWQNKREWQKKHKGATGNNNGPTPSAPTPNGHPQHKQFNKYNPSHAGSGSRPFH